jgi:hypothetical protein
MTGSVVVLAAAGLVGLLLGLLIQTLLLRAALALADVQEVSFTRSFVLVVLVLALGTPLTFLAVYLLGLSGPLAGTPLGVALLVGLGLLLSWAVPTLVYVPGLPVPLKKGMLVAVLELLLRALLGALVAAVVLVVLAVLQVVFTPTEPAPKALRGPVPVAWAVPLARLP